MNTIRTEIIKKKDILFFSSPKPHHDNRHSTIITVRGLVLLFSETTIQVKFGSVDYTTARHIDFDAVRNIYRKEFSILYRGHVIQWSRLKELYYACQVRD